MCLAAFKYVLIMDCDHEGIIPYEGMILITKAFLSIGYHELM